MNKKQKTERCQEILYKYAAGGQVTAPEDRDFLLHIFEGHSEWEEKQGRGVESISVIPTSFRNRCFQLNRVDGTTVDISFGHSINGRSKLTDIRAACRSAIRSEIVKFRAANVMYGVTLCPFSGEVLTERNTHIDHFDVTFNEMFERWMSSQNIANVHSKIVSTETGGFQTYFVDRAIVEDFVDFHNLHCRLRAVSKTANLSILRS